MDEAMFPRTARLPIHEQAIKTAKMRSELKTINPSKTITGAEQDIENWHIDLLFSKLQDWLQTRITHIKYSFELVDFIDIPYIDILIDKIRSYQLNNRDERLIYIRNN
ncbi:MAG: hypothetical protein V1898_03920 [Patescibacteria group bacterium]